MRIILLGNAGAGKSTMARQLIGKAAIPRLSLDEIAWDGRTERKPHLESLKLLNAFIATNPKWVMEGCYGDLVEAALPHCTELRFLNPGVEISLKHCDARPWEPEKFPSAAEQNAMLHILKQWVSEYETRDDEYGLRRHRRIFEGFAGRKREYNSVAAYALDP